MQDNQKEELKKILQKSMSQEEIHEKLIEQKQKVEEKKQEEKTKQKKIFYILFTLLIMFLVVATTYYFVSNSQKIKTSQKKEEITSKLLKTQNTKNEDEITKKEEKVVIKEVIVEKPIPITKENFKEVFLSKNFNLAKCYDYKVFQVKPNNNCKDNLKEFLLNNTQALRFEIIAVIDNEDIKKVTTLSKDKIIQEYILRGMARDRVLEISWYTKEILGNEILLTPVNYYLNSKKQNKGVMIKAYY